MNNTIFSLTIKAAASVLLIVLASCTSTGGGRYPAQSTGQEVRAYAPSSLRYIIWNLPNVDLTTVDLTKLPKEAIDKLPSMAAVIEKDAAAAGKLLGTIQRIQQTIMTVFTKADGVTKFSEYTPSQLRYRALLILARTSSPALFKEFRFNEPVFFLPGDGKEKSTYVLARHHDVDVSFGKVGVPPENLTVIYTDAMEKTVKGPFMLSGEGTDANREKPGMHKVVNRPGDLSKAGMQKRVRFIIKQLMTEVLRNKATANSIDIAPAVSRNVPLGMVSEFFGFYPPDSLTQIQWSRNTQNSFFHNPLNVDALNQLAIASGTEMEVYIKQKLLPEVTEQLANGRRPYDTLGQMINGHAGLKGIDRVTTNVMGLVVGAGETSTLAVVRSLKGLLDRPDILKGAIEAAEKANRPGATAKDEEDFARYVFESLRFQPINPWVERRATNEYTITPIREGQTVADKTITITKDSRVLVSMESAMMDSAKYENPEAFLLTRDVSQYFHFSFDYHRCLGDDVAEVMIPEILKSLLVNFTGLSYAALPDAKGSPFPESWVLNFKTKSSLVSKRNYQFAKARAYFTSEAYANIVGGKEEVNVVNSYLQTNEDPARVLDSRLRIDLPGMFKRDDSLDSLQRKMIAKKTELGTREVCMSHLLTDDMKIPQRKQFCTLPFDFRSCYFLQRVAGQKSAQHAFNYCTYGKKLLKIGDIDKVRTISGSSEFLIF